jgi:hypothetical protein
VCESLQFPWAARVTQVKGGVLARPRRAGDVAERDDRRVVVGPHVHRPLQCVVDRRACRRRDSKDQPFSASSRVSGGRTTAALHRGRSWTPVHAQSTNASEKRGKRCRQKFASTTNARPPPRPSLLDDAAGTFQRRARAKPEAVAFGGVSTKACAARSSMANAPRGQFVISPTAPAPCRCSRDPCARGRNKGLTWYWQERPD